VVTNGHGLSFERISNVGLSWSPLLLDSSHPFISSISMSAPSPDWFTGFYNFPLINDSSDTWYESFEIESYPWDAGTDSGDTYLADNRPIDLPLWIYQLTADTVPPTNVFLDCGTNRDDDG
jgi:hypothetical protein